MSVHYSRTLKSVQIVDGFQDGVPFEYIATTAEDPFVMLAWKCPNLEALTIIGEIMFDVNPFPNDKF